MISDEQIKKAIGEHVYQSKKLACCLTDKKLKFIFANDTFLKASGYKKEELVGNSVSVILGESVLKLAWAEFSYFLKHKKIRKDTWHIYHKDGSKMQAVIETTTVKIEGDSYFLTIAVNITKEFELENKLEKEKNRLQSAVEGANLGLWDFNFYTKEFYANDIWWKMLGYPPQKYEDAFKFYTTLIHPEDVPLLIQEKDRIVSTGDNRFDLQLRLRHKRGDFIWIHSQGKVIEFGENNFINHAIGTHIDITRDRRSELLIQESEKKYRILTESLPNIIWTADADGYINYMNRHGLAFFGKKKKHFKTWEWKNFVSKEDVEEVEQKWFFAHKTKTAINHVHTFINLKGEEKWFQVLIFPQKDSDGDVNSWIGIASDIDKLVLAEKSLKISNNRLRSLIDASPAAIYSINTKGEIQDFWNPAAEKLLGWKREEVLGKILPHNSEENEGYFLERVHETIKKGEYSGVITRKDKFGNDLFLEVTGGCIYNASGSVSEIIVTLIDITELERNRDKLSQSLKEKETLLQEIHHRVKNNLAIVVSLLQLQIFRSDDSSEKYRLTEAQNRVHSIAMVHELLYQSDDFSSVDLITYYEKLIKTIQSNMQIDNTGVKLKLDIGISSLNINQAIPLGLLMNELVTNSFKYAFEERKSGFIALKIRRAGERVFVTYSDSGPGFDMSALEFKSGLGMKIMDSLLTQLDAEYDIDSTNKFEISLNFLEKGAGPLERAKD
ncbi:MAG: PAS domain S-box protein [Balneolaceae bacterium]|nr:PAS domain S-box protein [Balneolaceae bacterium]MBO6547957.1 PAS domain S-box protein [Balneolaceae bacterium]MBO6648470.1 PAS domain S-box protein [Balneolaceae bacterium]